MGETSSNKTLFKKIDGPGLPMPTLERSSVFHYFKKRTLNHTLLGPLSLGKCLLNGYFKSCPGVELNSPKFWNMSDGWPLLLLLQDGQSALQFSFLCGFVMSILLKFLSNAVFQFIQAPTIASYCVFDIVLFFTWVSLRCLRGKEVQGAKIALKLDSVK